MQLCSLCNIPSNRAMNYDPYYDGSWRTPISVLFHFLTNLEALLLILYVLSSNISLTQAPWLFLVIIVIPWQRGIIFVVSENFQSTLFPNPSGIATVTDRHHNILAGQSCVYQRNNSPLYRGNTETGHSSGNGFQTWMNSHCYGRLRIFKARPGFNQKVTMVL